MKLFVKVSMLAWVVCGSCWFVCTGAMQKQGGLLDQSVVFGQENDEFVMVEGVGPIKYAAFLVSNADFRYSDFFQRYNTIFGATYLIQTNKREAFIGLYKSIDEYCAGFESLREELSLLEHSTQEAFVENYAETMRANVAGLSINPKTFYSQIGVAKNSPLATIHQVLKKLEVQLDNDSAASDIARKRIRQIGYVFRNRQSRLFYDAYCNDTLILHALDKALFPHIIACKDALMAKRADLDNLKGIVAQRLAADYGIDRASLVEW